MRVIEEKLNYSANRLLQVFPKYFKTFDEAKIYEYRPEKIANKVYANRMGNGDEASGDGYKYCGRDAAPLVAGVCRSEWQTPQKGSRSARHVQWLRGGEWYLR